MPARKPQPKGIPNPGLSHGIIILVGGSPWSSTATLSGDQCRCIHPGAMTDAIPVLCACCCHGTPAAEKIAARIDYGAQITEAEQTIAPTFKPKGKAKYRLKK